MSAKLAWFYGWSHRDIENLNLDEAQDYYEAITVIEAQQTLLALRVQDWPNMKQAARGQWHRKLHKLAYPVTHKEEVTTERLVELLRAQMT